MIPFDRSPAGFTEDMAALPDDQTRRMALLLANSIREGKVKGVPLDKRIATGGSQTATRSTSTRWGANLASGSSIACAPRVFRSLPSSLSRLADAKVSTPICAQRGTSRESESS